MLKAYYTLTKPGIIYGNLMNTVAGFLLAAGVWRTFDVWLLLATLAGVALVIASACVINNYTDRQIDAKMDRTKTRGLVAGTVSVRSALGYATILGLAGFLDLALFTNALTVYLGIIAFVVYIVLYGIGKRRSVHGTIVGSIAGALPPVAGYCAVANTFDGVAWLLLLIFALWQMPHFYAIAMYRRNDYAAASLPVLPVEKGMRSAKLYVLVYIIGFLVSAMLLSLFGYTGFVYLIVVALIGIAWLLKGTRTFHAKDNIQWGRSMFFYSLKVILVLDVMLAVGALLP